MHRNAARPERPKLENLQSCGVDYALQHIFLLSDHIFSRQRRAGYPSTWLLDQKTFLINLVQFSMAKRLREDEHGNVSF